MWLIYAEPEKMFLTQKRLYFFKKKEVGSNRLCVQRYTFLQQVVILQLIQANIGVAKITSSELFQDIMKCKLNLVLKFGKFGSRGINFYQKLQICGIFNFKHVAEKWLILQKTLKRYIFDISELNCQSFVFFMFLYKEIRFRVYKIISFHMELH